MGAAIEIQGERLVSGTPKNQDTKTSNAAIYRLDVGRPIQIRYDVSRNFNSMIIAVRQVIRDTRNSNMWIRLVRWFATSKMVAHLLAVNISATKILRGDDLTSCRLHERRTTQEDGSIAWI